MSDFVNLDHDLPRAVGPHKEPLPFNFSSVAKESKQGRVLRYGSKDALLEHQGADSPATPGQCAELHAAHPTPATASQEKALRQWGLWQPGMSKREAGGVLAARFRR